MVGIIPAAGKVTRIGEFCEKYPKALYPYKGQPILWYNLDWLFDEGCNYVIVVANHKITQIRATVRAYRAFYPDRKVHILKQNSLNGSLGAVEIALDFMQKADSVIIMFSDLIIRPNADKFYMANLIENILSVAYVDDWERWVMVDISDDGRKIKSYINKPKEKPKTDLSWSGIVFAVNSLELLRAINKVTESTEHEVCLSEALKLMTFTPMLVPILNFGTYEDCIKHGPIEQAIESAKRRFEYEN